MNGYTKPKVVLAEIENSGGDDRYDTRDYLTRYALVGVYPSKNCGQEDNIQN